MARAVFLDRDGTIVEDPGFLPEPGKVRLLRARARPSTSSTSGVPVVTVSNQAGIARGRYAVADYEAVQRRLAELLASHQARLDGSYSCPHHPDVTGPCDCRKPGVKLSRTRAPRWGSTFARSCCGRPAVGRGPARALGGRPFRGDR